MATQEQPGRKISSTVEDLLRLHYYFCVRGGWKCRGRAVVIRARKSSSAVSDQQSVGSSPGCDTCCLNICCCLLGKLGKLVVLGRLLRLHYYLCIRGGRKWRGRAVIRAAKSSSAVSDQKSVGSRHGCDTCVLGWDVKLRALCVVLKTIARIKDVKDPITHLFLILHVALGHSSVCLSLFVLCSCVSST